MNLSQLIKEPTRICNTRSSLLDHALTNREELYYKQGTIDFGHSDHSLIYIARKKRKLRRTVTKINCRNYRKLNESEFRSRIERTDWTDVLTSEDPNTAAMLFHESFCAVSNVYAPFKTINVKESAPAWVNGEYLSHVDEKKHACKEY